jgi:2-polyprenyl-6-methoxyphenol hydroxylase-like FAD-dependent oxidoreductase
MSRSYKIAVIGSGAAGMASALFLKRSGHQVTLIEKVEKPGPVGAGVLLQPVGMFVLEQLGILDKFLDTGAVINRLYGENQQGKRVLNLVYDDFQKGSYGLGIHRGAIFNILLKEVVEEGIEYITGCSVDRLIRKPNGSVELFREEDSKFGTFDAVILCDGRNSKLRKDIRVKQKIHNYKWGALWTILEDKEKLYSDELRQVYGTTKNIAGLLPIGKHPVSQENSVSLFWSLRQSRLDNWRDTPIECWKKEVIALYPEMRGLMEKIHSQDQLFFASYSHITLKKWHDEQLLCIGDAAHAMSPQLGQGVALGLYDAWILNKCLNEKDDIASAFKEYSRCRSSHIRWLQFVSKLVTPMFQSSGSDWAPYRDFTFNQIHNFGFTHRLMLGTLSGVQRGFLRKAEKHLMDFVKSMPVSSSK